MGIVSRGFSAYADDLSSARDFALFKNNLHLLLHGELRMGKLPNVAQIGNRIEQVISKLHRE
jgi:hypothetical protein